MIGQVGILIAAKCNPQLYKREKIRGKADCALSTSRNIVWKRNLSSVL